MNLIIADLLSDAQLDAVAETMQRRELFRDGAQTAGVLARPLKRNLQARDGERVSAALELVSERLLDHPLVRSAARPKRLIRLMANRYEVGMHYGNHIDEAIIEGQRTDLSFTLALSDPNEYEGGDLVIETDDQTQRFKLNRGELLLYPSHTLHRVEAVTRGVRLAVVGWIRSWIAESAQREILFDLDRVIETLQSALIEVQAADRTALDRAQRARARLMRMWAR